MKIFDVYINESNSYVVEVEAKDEYEAHDEVFNNLNKYLAELCPSDAGYSDISVEEAIERKPLYVSLETKEKKTNENKS